LSSRAQRSRGEFAGSAHIIGAKIDDRLAGFAGKFLDFAIDLSGYLRNFPLDIRRALLLELRFNAVIHGFPLSFQMSSLSSGGIGLPS
jgi:hypothetical protein